MTLTSPPVAPKLLIAIPACFRYSYFDGSGSSVAHQTGADSDRANAVRDTWYRTWATSTYYRDGITHQPLDLKFFYGLPSEPQSPPVTLPDSVSLDVPDDYLHLGLKVQAMFAWALEHGYDYVLKVDDDVFVWLDRLLSRFTPADYLGFVAENATGAYVCGASYWISRKAMQAVVDAKWTMDDWAEDRWVGKVLREAGITPVHDDRHRVCHCDICEKKYPVSDCTTFHVWPDITRMKVLHESI